MRDQLKYYLSIPLLAYKRFEVEDALIICSEARGGSTWLMEMLNHLPGSIVNWEPLHQDRGLIPENFGWSRRPYISEDYKAPTFKKKMEEILTYQRHSAWAFLRSSWTDAYRAQFVITKFVRAIPMLPWLMRQFDFRHAPILLLRHPIDTCASMIKAFGLERDNEGKPRIPERIKQRHPDELTFLRQLDNPLEHRVAVWCLDNLPTLHNEHIQQKAVWVYYEHLVMEPKAEVERILYATGFEEACPSVLERMSFRQASQTDFEQQLHNDPEQQLWKNLKKLSEDEKANIQHIFDRYGMQYYTAFTPFPVRHKVIHGLRTKLK